jgi:uncharacterized membrane protein
MRTKITEDKKRKNLTISIDPRILEIWEKYCADNDIENVSAHIEKIIIKKLNINIDDLNKKS